MVGVLFLGFFCEASFWRVEMFRVSLVVDHRSTEFVGLVGKSSIVIFA